MCSLAPACLILSCFQPNHARTQKGKFIKKENIGEGIAVFTAIMGKSKTNFAKLGNSKTETLFGNILHTLTQGKASKKEKLQTWAFGLTFAVKIIYIV